MSPRTAISLARNFRIEGLARTANPPSSRDVKATSMTKAFGMAPRSQSPIPLDDPKVLLSSLESSLSQATPQNRGYLASTLLERFGDLAAQSNNVDNVDGLRNKILSALIGSEHAKHTRGGSAKDAAKLRKQSDVKPNPKGERT